MANASLFNEREPITGNRSNDSNKIFVTDFNSTPALAYVDIKLSSTTNQKLEISMKSELYTIVAVQSL